MDCSAGLTNATNVEASLLPDALHPNPAGAAKSLSIVVIKPEGSRGQPSGPWMPTRGRDRRNRAHAPAQPACSAPSSVCALGWCGWWCH